jgi:DNA-binding Lrp family transcriptional regulator
MDDVDKGIIRLLKRDGRATYGEIGEKVGLSEGAVRKRIRDLTDAGVIKRFTVMVGLTEGSAAITLVAINPSFPTSTISDMIVSIPDVESVYEITGQYDIAVLISALNVVEVNACVENIRRVEGVINTNTMIILRSL